MEVVLAGRRVVGPGAAAEMGTPVVRPVAPDIPVPLRIISRGARRPEPGVLVGGMARYPIQEEAQAARVRLAEQAVEGAKGAVGRVDRTVVTDVVAEVRLRRGIDRREPERVDAQPGQVIQ